MPKKYASTRAKAVDYYDQFNKMVSAEIEKNDYDEEIVAEAYDLLHKAIDLMHAIPKEHRREKDWQAIFLYNTTLIDFQTKYWKYLHHIHHKSAMDTRYSQIAKCLTNMTLSSTEHALWMAKCAEDFGPKKFLTYWEKKLVIRKKSDAKLRKNIQHCCELIDRADELTGKPGPFKQVHIFIAMKYYNSIDKHVAEDFRIAAKLTLLQDHSYLLSCPSVPYDKMTVIDDNSTAKKYFPAISYLTLIDKKDRTPADLRLIASCASRLAPAHQQNDDEYYHLTIECITAIPENERTTEDCYKLANARLQTIKFRRLDEPDADLSDELFACLSIFKNFSQFNHDLYALLKRIYQEILCNTANKALLPLSRLAKNTFSDDTYIDFPARFVPIFSSILKDKNEAVLHFLVQYLEIIIHTCKDENFVNIFAKRYFANVANRNQLRSYLREARAALTPPAPLAMDNQAVSQRDAALGDQPKVDLSPLAMSSLFRHTEITKTDTDSGPNYMYMRPKSSNQ